MRGIASACFVFLAVGLIGCGDKGESGGGNSSASGNGSASYAAAQKTLEGVAGAHAGLQRLTLHAVPAGKDGSVQIASTMASRRGKPSDPEDLKAFETGEEIVLDEDGAVDVTVPILVKDGKPGAVAGVTVALEEGADRDAAIAEARTIAKELEKAIQAAGGGLW